MHVRKHMIDRQLAKYLYLPYLKFRVQYLPQNCYPSPFKSNIQIVSKWRDVRENVFVGKNAIVNTNTFTVNKYARNIYEKCYTWINFILNIIYIFLCSCYVHTCVLILYVHLYWNCHHFCDFIVLIRLN